MPFNPKQDLPLREKQKEEPKQEEVEMTEEAKEAKILELWKEIEEMESKAKTSDDWDKATEKLNELIAFTVRSNFADKEKEVKKWLYDHNNFNASSWKELPDFMKHFVINKIFEENPGEIFSIGYIPSMEVRQLHEICRTAGEQEFFERINELISLYKEACPVRSSHVYLQDPYRPSPDEQELIARVMDIFRKSGYLPLALPHIFLSSESPPLFVAYPELEDEWEESNNKPIKSQNERCNNDNIRKIPVNRQRGRPETISIEEVLGCYVPNQHIILYARGIRWIARRNNFDEDMVRAIVLVHEIGHWITHLLPKPGIPQWSNKIYKQTAIDVHEGWAQLITWWVVDQIGGSIKDTFEQINKFQPPEYKVFEKFKGKSSITITASLQQLRQLRYPARLGDWQDRI